MEIDLNACLNGDEAAWSQFCDQTVRLVIASIRRVCPSGRTPSGLDVDDLVQAVYVKLLRNDRRLLRRFDPNKASMSTWITLVARSVSIDALRRRALDTFSINEAMHVPEPPPETPIGAPEIPPGLLTARQRLVLKLLYEDELDVADAASVLNVTPQTIRSTKHKAMERLRTHFGPEHPGDTPPDEAVQSQENA